MAQGEGSIYPAPTHKRVNELDEKLIQLQKSTRASIPAMVWFHDTLRQKFRWYYAWHMNAWSNAVHWSLLTGYTVAAVVLMVTLVAKGPAHQIFAASKQSWATADDWKNWKLENLAVTADGIRLAQRSVQGISTQRIAQVVESATPIISAPAIPEISATPSASEIASPTVSATASQSASPSATPTATESTLATPTPSTLPTESTTFATTGTATISFDPHDQEIVDWLGSEISDELNGGQIKVEFSTDNILWTEDAKTLANSNSAYLRLTLSTTDITTSPVLKTFAVDFSRLPKTPTDLKVSAETSFLTSGQVLSAGTFTDPDNDIHQASEWQVTNQSGEYTTTLVDSGIDTKNLTTYTVSRKLTDGNYYFRVRYQDSTGAWSPWSAECGFIVAGKSVSVVGDKQIPKDKNEIVTKRTETTKTIDNKNGTKTLESFSGIIHYKTDYTDPKAQWLDINPDHYVDFPDFVLYDQMPSTVKVYKDKIGYEIQSRKTGEKYTVELQNVDGTPAVSTTTGANGLVSWADINNSKAKIEAQNKLIGQFINPVLAQDSTDSSIIDNGNLKFEFQISENGVRLWKTIDGAAAPKNFQWKITKSGSGNDLKFRDNPDAYQIDANGLAQTDQKVTIDAKVIAGDKNSTFTWQETALTSDLKIDTDVTFNPDASPENTSADSYMYQTGPSDWFGMTYNYGSGYDNTAASGHFAGWSSSNNQYDNVYRSIFTFDTSSIPSSVTVNSATFSVYGTGKSDDNSWAPSLNVYSSNPSYPNSLYYYDYYSFGSTAFATPIAYANYNTSGYNDFALNSTGISAVSLGGITKLGLRTTADAESSDPGVVSGSTANAYFDGYFSEQGDGYRPKLAVTYVDAGTCRWTGLGTDTNWSTPENWSDNTVPSSVCNVIFDSTSSKNSNIDTSFVGSTKSIKLDTGYAGELTASTNLTNNGDFILNAGTFTPGSQTINVGGSWTNGGGTFNKGTSTINLTGTNPNTTIQTNSQQFYNLNVAGQIANDSYTKLLIHADGANNSNSFTDESGHAVTANGDAKISTTTSKFGGSSAYFDGSGDSLSIPASSDFNIDSDFTFDFWFKSNSTTRYTSFFSNEGSGGGWTLLMNNANAYAGDIAFYGNGGTPVPLVTSTGGYNDGNFHHVALVRNGSNWQIYVDGTSRASVTNGNNNTAGTTAYIGNNHTFANRDFAGYMDEIRISKGIARWTGNFSVPTITYFSSKYTLSSDVTVSNNTAISGGTLTLGVTIYQRTIFLKLVVF